MPAKSYTIYSSTLCSPPWSSPGCSREFDLTFSCDKVYAAEIMIKHCDKTNGLLGATYSSVQIDGADAISIGPVPIGQCQSKTNQIPVERVCGTHTYKVCVWGEWGMLYPCAEVSVYLTLYFEEGGGASMQPPLKMSFLFFIIVLAIVGVLALLSLFAVLRSRREEEI